MLAALGELREAEAEQARFRDVPIGLETPEGAPPAEIATDVARGAIAAGLEPENLAVITPYDAQKDRISGLLDVEGLEVDTVDGFQGREKELVVLSLVRSNERGELGFLTDLRRLNVAPTRARRKLVVADSDTIAAHEAYRALVEHADERGQRVEPV